MDVKQIHSPILNSNSIKPLLLFVQNVEQKLLSIENIHQKLNQLIVQLSKTHQNIREELITIKTILNDHQIIQIDQNKSLTDEEDEQIQLNNSIENFHSQSITNLSSTDRQINSASTHQTDRLSLYSPSSYGSSSTNSSNNLNRPNSSTSKRSSNLTKSDQSTRPKSPKSVTFSIEQNNQSTIQPNNQQTVNQPIQNEISDQIPRSNSDLIPDLFKQHHDEVTHKQNIGYKLGNALTNVRIHEIESINGDYLRLLNISNSDDYDLTGHFLQQNIACVPLCRFRFPLNTIIRAGQTVTIWCGSLRDIEPQPPHIFLWKEQKRWENGPECVTILAKPSGQAIAWARSSHRINTDQSSSDILFIHSKSNSGISDTPSITPNSFKSRSRLSAFHFIGNNKPPFAHSPSSPIHPDNNGGYSNIQNDLRSQMHQRSGISPLLNRPKSSPFASHTGCKQDLISMNYLRSEQKQGHKQTTVKT